MVPHAGYPYSGPIAASAYLRLAAGRGDIRRVVLVGPSHRVAFRGIAVSGADVFRTPLGDIPIDDDARRLALRRARGGARRRGPRPRAQPRGAAPVPPDACSLRDRARPVGPDGFALLPLVTGSCRDHEVAEVLDAVWGGPETVVVVSTDLSHYHRYAEARELDRRTAAAIVAGRADAVGDRDACGASGLRGLLVAAHDRGAAGGAARPAQLRRHRRRPREGGGLWRLRPRLTAARRPALKWCSTGRPSRSCSASPSGAIADGLRGRRPRLPEVAELHPAIRPHRGVFVTLTVDDRLNGCIGTIEATEPLGRGVPRNAWSAAFADPRLPALRPADVELLTVSISVLSPLSPIAADSREELLGELRPGTDGLVIEAGSRRGVFLPSVWDQLPDRDEFLDHLLAKAGLRVGSWPRGLRAERFTTTGFTRRVADGVRGAAPAGPDLVERGQDLVGPDPFGRAPFGGEHGGHAGSQGMESRGIESRA